MQTETAIVDPIELLMEEHRLIERVLDALDARVAEPARFVAFFGEFADGQHHGKEEEILFRAMIEAGVPERAGPIAVMLHEHDLGRTLMNELAAATSWTPEAEHAARSYSALLRQHIQKEDRILYPMARKILGREMAAVADACSRFTHAHHDARLRALAAELITKGAS
jgi:hemerythrin-like domain-containing protein